MSGRSLSCPEGVERRPGFRAVCFGGVAILLPLSLLFLSACSLPRQAPPLRPPPEQAIQSTDWQCTWKGDASDVTIEPLPDGSLRVSVTGNPQLTGKGAILSTPLRDRQLLPDAKLVLHVSTPGAPFDLAPAVRTDEYYEGVRLAICTPQPSTITLDLATNTFMSEGSGWAHTTRINTEAGLQSVELVLYPSASQTRTIVIHSARLVAVSVPPPPLPRPWRPLAIAGESLSEDSIAQYSLAEIQVLLTPAYTNPFDPAEITLDATFVSPSGVTSTCPGFLHAYAAAEEAPDSWRVRFSPNERGPWQWKVTATTPAGRAASRTHRFFCSAPLTPGPVRRAAGDPKFFEHADGTFFYPLGHNVCWNTLDQYREQFARMAQNGANWSRIWIAPWNCEIEWSPRGGQFEGLGRYDLRQAEKLDGILQAAEANGIYVQLVLHEHCRVSARTNPEWHNNPYNAALGGPCASPREFFTHADARRLARNRIRYIIARWGFSSHVMAWELFNEVDLSDDFRFDVDARWHREMAAFIRATDPHGRMITTSYISNPNADTLRLPEIDFTQSHVYVPDVASFFAYLYPVYAAFDKPHFIGEFGRDPMDGVDAKDVAGKVLHSGIWAQFMTPDAGNAMSWWWYDHIDPHNLYFHYAALAGYAKGLDRRGSSWTLQTGRFEPDNGSDRNVLALVSPGAVYFWMYDPEILPWNENPSSGRRDVTGTLVVSNAAPGTWAVEQWDTYDGKIVRSAEVRSTDGVVRVPIDAGGPDAAYKLKHAGPPAAASVPQLDLAFWDPRAPAGDKRKQITIRRAPGPIAIDGNLGEWGSIQTLEVTPTDGRMAADNSMHFSLAHDGADLFIAVRVTDDELVRRNGPGGSLWKDDGVEFWIDSMFDADFFSNMPNNPGCYQIAVAPAVRPGGKVDTTAYRHPDWNDKEFPHIDAASRITDDGYIVEARIPLDKLRNGRSPRDPNRIGFNISSCDADPEGNETTWHHLLWQGTHEWDGREWAVGVLE